MVSPRFVFRGRVSFGMMAPLSWRGRHTSEVEKQMHCSNCGSYVAPGVRFCSGCGAPAIDPEATRLARTQSGLPTRQEAELAELEHTIFTVKPTMIFIKLGYGLAVIGAVVLVFLLALIEVPAYISIPLALALLLIPAYFHIRRNLIRYTLTDSKIEIDTGLIARMTRISR